MTEIKDDDLYLVTYQKREYIGDMWSVPIWVHKAQSKPTEGEALDFVKNLEDPEWDGKFINIKIWKKELIYSNGVYL